MTKVEVINALYEIQNTCIDIINEGKTCRDCPYHILDAVGDEFCSLYVAFDGANYFKDPCDWKLNVMKEAL